MKVETQKDRDNQAWRFMLIDDDRSTETYRSLAVYTSSNNARNAGVDGIELYGQGIRDGGAKA